MSCRDLFSYNEYRGITPDHPSEPASPSRPCRSEPLVAEAPIRRLLVPLLLLLAVAPAHAGGFAVSIWRAFGVVNTNGVKQYIDTSFGTYQTSFDVRSTSLGGFTLNTMTGIDAGYEFVPGLVIGARLAQVKVSEGTVFGTVTDNPVTGRTGDFSITVNSSLTPYMVGGTYTAPLSPRLSASAALYLGYALGDTRLRYEDGGRELFGPSSPFGRPGQETTFSGSGIADDLSGELRYALSRNLALGLHIHFFSAKITETTSAAGAAANSALAFDYSNVSLGFSLDLSF